MHVSLEYIVIPMVDLDTVLPVHEMLLSYLVPVVFTQVMLLKPIVTMELLGVILVMI